jgi:hypothetical protein
LGRSFYIKEGFLKEIFEGLEKGFKSSKSPKGFLSLLSKSSFKSAFLIKSSSLKLSPFSFGEVSPFV